MSLSPVGIPRRRNGRHQACEPCRRRKVSCGHETPVCVRCRRRNAARDCIYIVGGRALQFDTVASGSPTTRRRVGLETLADAAGSEPAVAERRLDQMQPPIVTPPEGDGHYEPHQPQSGGPTPPGSTRNYLAGFLGPTSFSAVYLETESSLASVQGQPISNPPSGGSPSILQTPMETKPASPAQQPAVEVELLEKGIEVLRLVPDAAMGTELFRQHTNPNDGWNRMASERVMLSMYDVFGHVLRQGGTSGLREMALLLTQNAKRPLDENIEDPDEWVASFSGWNLRWETLGAVFVHWAYASMNWIGINDARDQDSYSALWQNNQDRLPRKVRFYEAARMCIQLSNPAVNYSTVMIYLRFRHMLLESNISGDASLMLATLHGELSGLITFAGMHAEPQSQEYMPTAASESRRKLFAMMFTIDKVHATFTGRPPLLSRRYVSTPLPLDIPNEVLLSDRATIATAVAKLDHNGWNTDGNIYSTTILRARSQLAFVRDAILEVSLGQDTSVETLLRIRDMELETISEFPESLTFNSNDVTELPEEFGRREPINSGPNSLPQVVDGAAFYARVLVRLEHFKNLFFLERLLSIKRGRSLELLSISVDMVALTLVFWTHKNRLYSLHGDFDWLVMSYASPAGGVLCMELINPTPRPLDETGAEVLQDPKLSRSNIIQNLSLLVAFLSWVAPSAPNGPVCHSVKGVIQRVMDFTLNNPAAPPTAGQPVNLAGARLDIDVNDPFFNFDLMDTFDWLRSEGGPDAMQAA